MVENAIHLLLDNPKADSVRTVCEPSQNPFKMWIMQGDGFLKELIDTDIVIWTTTPWTIPGNRALAYGKDLDYSLIEVQEIAENSLAQVGDLIVLAKELKNTVLSQIGVVKQTSQHVFSDHVVNPTVAIRKEDKRRSISRPKSGDSDPVNIPVLLK